MVELLIPTLIISAIAALLAVLLVVAQRMLANYGECRIDINEGTRELTVEGGESLLQSLSENKIFVPSACGGRGSCAYCKVAVVEGGGPVLPTEEPYLDKQERGAKVRLSCQVKVRNDVQIRIPDALFAVREFRGTCTHVRDLTHDIKAFRIELNEPATMTYVPGQYVQLFAPAYDGNEEVYRAYSIASDPRDDKVVELVIRLVPNGICTTWCFHHLKEGTPIMFNGPYGEFRLSDTQAPMVFVAGGSGMAPIRSMLYQMERDGIQREATYYFGVNATEELFYEDEMARFEKVLAGYRFVPVVAGPDSAEHWKGETGLVTEAIARAGKDLTKHEAYLCGSPGMIDASIKVLTELGVLRERIFFDTFA